MRLFGLKLIDDATVFFFSLSPAVTPLFFPRLNLLSTSISFLRSLLPLYPPETEKKHQLVDFNTTALLSDAQAKLSGIQEQVRDRESLFLFSPSKEEERERLKEREKTLTP